MNKIFVKDGDIVYPGEIIGENLDNLSLEGVYKEKNKYFSKYFGIVKLENFSLRIIPFNKTYLPKEGDFVIGEIKEVLPTGWIIDINSPFLANLPLKEMFNERIVSGVDISKFYDVGDVIAAKIINVSRNKSVKLSVKSINIGKLNDYYIFLISPTKIPKILGKKGRNIEKLRELLNVDIVVGQNGVICVKANNRKKELETAEIIKNFTNSLKSTNIQEFIK